MIVNKYKFRLLRDLRFNKLADKLRKTSVSYPRIIAAKIREALIKKKGYQTKELPCRQTIGDLLNRSGYSLKKHKKSNP